MLAECYVLQETSYDESSVKAVYANRRTALKAMIKGNYLITEEHRERDLLIGKTGINVYHQGYGWLSVRTMSIEGGKDFNLLNQQLMTLLDRIEIKRDPTLAKQRFNILKSFGYVVMWDGPNTSTVH